MGIICCKNEKNYFLYIKDSFYAKKELISKKIRRKYNEQKDEQIDEQKDEQIDEQIDEMWEEIDGI